MAALTINDLRSLTGNTLGIHDVACPSCGPSRNSPNSRLRKVFRIWFSGPDHAGYNCVRCGLQGGVHDGAAYLNNVAQSGSLRDEIARHNAERVKKQADKAKYLASLARPALGTIAETYLRKARGYDGRIPDTLKYLPPRGEHRPALLGLFGFPDEPEPGVLEMPLSRIVAVHLTRLKPDGSGKDGDPEKIFVGSSLGTPIVIAPMNDQLGLLICEGIETGLSHFDASGLGVWVAGSAALMPALADRIPDWTDHILVDREAGEAGETNAEKLLSRIKSRNLKAEILSLGGRS